MRIIKDIYQFVCVYCWFLSQNFSKFGLTVSLVQKLFKWLLIDLVMIANYLLHYLFIVVFVLTKSLLNKSQIKSLLLCHLHQDSHLFFTQIIIFFASESIQIFLRVDFLLSLINYFFHIYAFSEKLVIVMSSSIIVYYLLFKAFCIFFFNFVKFFSIFLLLKEKIIIYTF